MSRRARPTLALLAVALVTVGLAAPALAAVEPYRQDDYGGFRSVLPPGTHGVFNAAEATAFLTTGAYPPHSTDQRGMYGDLIYAAPGLAAADIPDYFKDASFGVPAGQAERSYSPRPGVTIVRDRGFGVPHIYGDTRADTIFGAGYAGAEDRLFFMDLLRHAGRAQLSGFAGGANKDMDKEVWEIAPYLEQDLQRQIDQMNNLYGAEGYFLQQDLVSYVAGINKYIAEARLDPTKLPAEYAAINEPLEDWKGTDVIAIAALIGGIFGKGGGSEVESAEVLAAARARFGPIEGTLVWNDFRRNEDPEAPTTVRGTSFPYQVGGDLNQAAVAKPDPGSLVDPDPATPEPTSASLGRSVLGPMALLGGNSNALLVRGAHSSSGHPLAVMGPQTGYFMPEILLEQDLHGPDIDAAGAAFAGVSPYVLLGRGQDFAWSATSAGQDIIDTFAEELCEPDGSTPTVHSMHYRYKGQCRRIEVLTRVNEITPNPADPSPAETYTLRAQRTVHGIVHKRGTVGGKPVAFARQRSTYFHEADSARAFAALNRPSQVRSVQDFQRVVSKVNFTFNWFYADDRDIGYFNSGDNPVRAPGVSHAVPNWGTGEFDWRGFKSTNHTASYTPFAEHPQVVNQSYLTSWNNKQAPGYRASDGQWGYGPLYRSQMLDLRVEQKIAGGRKTNLAEMIDAMEDAGSVDLRGERAAIWMLRVIGQPTEPALADAVRTLKIWLFKGSHRRDRDGDGNYEDARAVQIMDAWWPRAIDAQFKSVLGNDLFAKITRIIEVDNAPNNHGAHLGSAYQTGWYGYVQKDLRRLLGEPVSGPFSRIYCGNGNLGQCRTALLDSLRAALAVTKEQLYQDSGCTDGDQRCFDEVRFRAVGAITVPPIPWINRPTYQQAVEVQGHRPR
jgi:acyl-homoserine lactone acylase PvdQ